MGRYAGAFEALDDETREKIASLAAYHSLYYSQAKVGHKARSGSSYGLSNQDVPLRPLINPSSNTASGFIYRAACPCHTGFE